MTLATKYLAGRRYHGYVRKALLLTAAACGRTDGLAPNEPEPSRIELSALPLAWVGQRDTLRAHVFDATGKELRTPSVQWSSADPAIAAIDSSGVLTGVGEGKTTVTATSGSRSTSMTIEVVDAVLVEVSGPDTLLVDGTAQLLVVARGSGGQLITNPAWATFASSDPSRVEVRDDGAVVGRQRGTATISVRVRDATASIVVAVTAPIKIDMRYRTLSMDAVDTLTLRAVYVNVNGLPISEKPLVSWWSNNPSVVRVSADGIVTATAAAIARIYAATDVDTAFAELAVSDSRPGQPTIIRYVHALPETGPITFVPSVGDTVTLSFGESAERSIAPGSYVIRADVPGHGQAVAYDEIRDGDILTLAAVGGSDSNSTQAFLQSSWSRHVTLPPGWSRLRVIQGSGFSTYFLRPRGESIVGVLPEECYFDSGVHEPFGAMPIGSYDVIPTTKYPYGPGPPAVIARLPVELPSGRAITAILIGRSAKDAGIVTFIGP